jgi:molybdate-binding protein
MSGSTQSNDPAKPNLTLVSDDVYHLNRKPETGAERIRRLQLEAKVLAREQIEGLERSMLALADQARELSEGGDAYPVGIRDLAARMAEELDAKAQTMKAVMDRVPLPPL